MSTRHDDGLSLLLLALAGVATSGCAEGAGSVEVAIDGEQAAEIGYPAGDIAFADGWSMTFDHLFVAVEGFSLADAATSVPLEAPSTLVDLTGGEQIVWSFPSVPAQRWPNVGYDIAPPTSATRRLGEVAQSDLDAMIAAGASFRMMGTASHPTQGSFTLDLVLPLRIETHHCQSGRDGTDGLVVPASARYVTQITTHLDHLFFDSARAEEPALRFDAWAAVAGDDRVITLDDLETQQLADLHDASGEPLLDDAGAPVIYEPPSTGLPRQTLGAFVIAQAITIGHFEGEGHCEYVAR
ncbi:MAG: hypothetical protein K1X94_12790 [Sandaracinaceae bacterium]|nr:hypothetical protein [Sandaracinaceae bacterium]